MDTLQALILGLLQGLTEFIPVSSSGHLVLVPWLLNWQSPGLAFDTTVHLGTLAGLVVYFRRDIWEVGVSWLDGWRTRTWSSSSARLGWLIILGSVPAGVLGFLFEDWFASLFGQPGMVAVMLVATGILLASSERMSQKKNAEVLGITAGMALIIGFAQAGAILPGISRSGATIAAGLALGLTRPAAARFSFLLALPIIFAAGFVQLAQVVKVGSVGESMSLLAVGFLAAAISGYVCINFLLSYLQRRSLYVFAAYCWVAGIASLAVWLMSGGRGLG
ncbi:MAG: undecaprenyl-diphosphatase UppP [Chloroflexota bacterium]